LIVVKIELWPFGEQAGATEIGRMYVANDGAGTREHGGYRVAACRRGNIDVPREVYSDDRRAMIEHTDAKKLPKAARAGVVKDYPRLAYNVWRLIGRAILAAFPEEDKPAKKGRAPRFDALVANGFAILAEPLRLALQNPAMIAALPSGEAGDAVHAALDWLDGAGGE
jgi:hypothetical protein